MILETETFERWMHEIIARLDRQERMLSLLTGKEVKEAMYVDGEASWTIRICASSCKRASSPCNATAVRGCCVIGSCGTKPTTLNRTYKSS